MLLVVAHSAVVGVVGADTDAVALLSLLLLALVLSALSLLVVLAWIWL